MVDYSPKLDKYELTILKKMVRDCVWKGYHRQIDNLKKNGFPKNENGNVKDAIYSLIKTY